MRDGASLSSHAPAAKDGGVATAKHVRAHICEVQLLLELTHSLKFVAATTTLHVRTHTYGRPGPKDRQVKLRSSATVDGKCDCLDQLTQAMQKVFVGREPSIILACRGCDDVCEIDPFHPDGIPSSGTRLGICRACLEGLPLSDS